MKAMKKSSETRAKRIFRAEWKQLTAHEREVIEGMISQS
jgi:hypothetical protein